MTRMQQRFLASTCVALFACALSLPAPAQERATAQQLFLQGRKLLKEGKTEQACTKFKGAAQLSKTPGVRLNLAGCWLKLGRTASAWAMYDEALSIAEQDGNTAAAKFAREQRSKLQPKLTYLDVQVPTAARIDGLALERDGEPLPRGAWGTEVPVDPGQHKLTASAPGYKSWSTERQVTAEGTHVKIVVPTLVALPHAAPRAAGAPPPQADIQSSSGRTQRVLAIVSGGLGVVGLGVGSFFGLRAISKKNDYKSQLDAAGQCPDAACSSTSHDASVAGNVSTVAFVAGGVLLGAGVVLWLTAPRAHHASAGVVPMLGEREAGLSVEGRF